MATRILLNSQFKEPSSRYSFKRYHSFQSTVHSSSLSTCKPMNSVATNQKSMQPNVYPKAPFSKLKESRILSVIPQTENFSPRTAKPQASLAKATRKLYKKLDPIRDETPIESLPTAANWENSERLMWNKRRTHLSNLVIVQFEGVLGDFFKVNIWSGQGNSLYLRPGWFAGLRKLAYHCYIVIFFSGSHARGNSILEFLDKKRITIDAAYMRTGLFAGYLQDYSQVIGEFRISIEKLFLITSVGLDEASLNQRECLGLITDNSLSSHKRVLVIGLPVGMPHITVLLLSNPRAQEKLLTVTFDFISTMLCKYFMGIPTMDTFRYDALPSFSDTGEITSSFNKTLVLQGDFLPKKKYQSIETYKNKTVYPIHKVLSNRPLILPETKRV